MSTYTVTAIRKDHGSIMEFLATDENGQPVIVAADHRPGRDIYDALLRGEEPQVEAPAWAVRSRA